MKEWIQEHEWLIVWAAAGSVVMFVGSLIVVPIIVTRMKPDYFMKERPITYHDTHPFWQVTGLILKNLAGAILLLAGIVMIIIPGQGLLTIFMGLALLNFPGKRAAELRLIRFGPLQRSINWIRARSHKPPLLLPPPRRDAK